ncbi:MAG: hypothetical protein R2822_10570 [Spirosomataceae bacterium]
MYHWLQAGDNQAVNRWRKFRWFSIFSIGCIVAAFMALYLGLETFLMAFMGLIFWEKLNASVKDYAEKSQTIVATLKAYAVLLEKIESHPSRLPNCAIFTKSLKGTPHPFRKASVPWRVSLKISILG